VHGFANVLNAVADASLELEPGVVQAALKSEAGVIRSDTVWYLVKRYAAETDKVPELAAQPFTGAATDEVFGREVLRRMRGGEAATRPEWLQWLRSSEGRSRVPRGKPVLRHLTLDEQNALTAEDIPGLPPVRPGNVARPPFTIPIRLPSGLGNAILRQAHCSMGWLGAASATVDRAGRVQSVDVSDVVALTPCRDALATMLRLSFADPDTIASPLTGSGIQQVGAAGSVCVDEGPLDNGSGGAMRPDGKIKSPQVRKKVEPSFPRDLVAKVNGPQTVVVETTISKTGCVADVRLVKQSEYPELNANALLAVAKWKFAPGTLDGQPVDVIFNLTINFNPH
jgi:TonB family protein